MIPETGQQQLQTMPINQDQQRYRQKKKFGSYTPGSSETAIKPIPTNKLPDNPKTEANKTTAGQIPRSKQDITA